MRWFLLTFRLPGSGADPETFLDALQEAGCSDATVAWNDAGSLWVDFARQADTWDDALRSAVRDVQVAIPGAVLTDTRKDSDAPGAAAPKA